MYTPPRINPFSGVQHTGFAPSLQMPKASMSGGFVDEAQKGGFKDVMANMVKDTDHTLNKPDELMNRALTTGDVDIHEVMIANTKADLTINVASQVVTKIIQAYERVQQIQV